mmetsp:Transcript_16364/g.44818  ORF Transcript_16364/g.44818 Transcript_16364/m.44818 type:complete len:287 (-) Transcript_16364:1627-2487(-)
MLLQLLPLLPALRPEMVITADSRPPWRPSCGPPCCPGLTGLHPPLCPLTGDILWSGGDSKLLLCCATWSIPCPGLSKQGSWERLVPCSRSPAKSLLDRLVNSEEREGLWKPKLAAAAGLPSPADHHTCAVRTGKYMPCMRARSSTPGCPRPAPTTRSMTQPSAGWVTMGDTALMVGGGTGEPLSVPSRLKPPPTSQALAIQWLKRSRCCCCGGVGRWEARGTGAGARGDGGGGGDGDGGGAATLRRAPLPPSPGAACGRPARPSQSPPPSCVQLPLVPLYAASLLQ